MATQLVSRTTMANRAECPTALLKRAHSGAPCTCPVARASSVITLQCACVMDGAVDAPRSGEELLETRAHGEVASSHPGSSQHPQVSRGTARARL